jgi:hypothetical protein
MFKYLIVAALIFAAFVTNPSEQSFKLKVETELLKELKLNKEKDLLSELITTNLVGSLLWDFIKSEYRDFKLCSTFDLQVGTKQIKFLGIFGQIIPLSDTGSIIQILKQLDK